MKTSPHPLALGRPLVAGCLALLCLHVLSGSASAQTYGHDPTVAASQAASVAPATSQLVILYGYEKGGPPLIIPGIQGPVGALPAGYITGVSFYGAPPYNFSLYVLTQPGFGEDNTPAGEYIFSASAPYPFVSGPTSSTTPGVQTLSSFGTSIPVNGGNVLAFIGTGPYYDTDPAYKQGDDATYQYATPPNPCYPFLDCGYYIPNEAYNPHNATGCYDPTDCAQNQPQNPQYLLYPFPSGHCLFGATQSDLQNCMYMLPSALATSLTPVPVTQALGAYTYGYGGVSAPIEWYPFFAVGGNSVGQTVVGDLFDAGASQAPGFPETFQYVPDSPAGTQARVYLIEVDFALSAAAGQALVLEGDPNVGQPGNFTITTQDSSSPLVTVSCSDPTAVATVPGVVNKVSFPINVQLVGGTATFSATFFTANSQPTLTVSSAAGEAYHYTPATLPVDVTCPTITIDLDPLQVPAGTVGAPYSQESFIATGEGGFPSYTFSYTFGPAGQPPGLSFPAQDVGSQNLSSTIGGTPTQAGTYTFTVTATDQIGCMSDDTTIYTLVVNPASSSPPTANPESFATLDSPGAVVTLTGSDPNNLPLTYTVPVNTANGGQNREDDPGWTSPSVIDGVYSIQWALANSPDSVAPTLKYIPPDFPIPDHYTFTVYNGTGYSPPATVDITVERTGSLTATLAPGSSVGGATAKLSSGASAQAVSVVGWPSNPNGTAAAFSGPAADVDLAVRPATTSGDSLTLQATFYYPNYPGYPTAAAPANLLYFPAGGSQWAYVLDSQGNQVPAVQDSAINGYSYTLNSVNPFNDVSPSGSTPELYQLTGTYFAMGTPAAAGPGPLDHFTISAISSPQMVEVAFPIKITAQDANNNTVTSFDSSLTFGGTAGVSGTMGAGLWSAGVYSPSVTATASGSSLTVTVTDGASPTPHTGSATIATINPYSNSSYYGNPLSHLGGADGSPPLVILGEYNSTAPLATSPNITLPAGTITDVKFYGGNYDFTFYVLSPGVSGPGSDELTFQVVSSQTFSGSASPGVQDLSGLSLTVNAGDLLAFAGIGPYYPPPPRTTQPIATLLINLQTCPILMQRRRAARARASRSELMAIQAMTTSIYLISF